LNNSLISKDKEAVEATIVAQLMDPACEWTLDTLEIVRDIGS